MKVFLSWSGAMSKDVASVLYTWLPQVIQVIRPWMSSEDIDRGARWSAEVARELDANGFGILCMTPDNLTAPWVLFEAGALSKAFDSARVCPYLVGVEIAALEGPLAQFNAARANRDDTLRLVETINKQLGDNKLDDGTLGEAFGMWWPRLEERLKASLAVPSTAVVPSRRPVPDMIEEVLEIQRTILRQMQTGQRRVSLSPVEVAVQKEWAKALYESLAKSEPFIPPIKTNPDFLTWLIAREREKRDELGGPIGGAETPKDEK